MGSQVICQTCRDDRVKRGLRPMDRITLPERITDSPSFRHPGIATFVCPNCDGEELVNNALRSFAQRKRA